MCLDIRAWWGKIAFNEVAQQALLLAWYHSSFAHLLSYMGSDASVHARVTVALSDCTKKYVVPRQQVLPALRWEWCWLETTPQQMHESAESVETQNTPPLLWVGISMMHLCTFWHFSWVNRNIDLCKNTHPWRSESCKSHASKLAWFITTLLWPAFFGQTAKHMWRNSSDMNVNKKMCASLHFRELQWTSSDQGYNSPSISQTFFTFGQNTSSHFFSFLFIY